MIGGSAKRVIETTGNIVGPAQPVIEVSNREITAGPVIKGVFVDAGYVAQNGLIEGPAMPIVVVVDSSQGVIEGPIMPFRKVS